MVRLALKQISPVSAEEFINLELEELAQVAERAVQIDWTRFIFDCPPRDQALNPCARRHIDGGTIAFEIVLVAGVRL